MRCERELAEAGFHGHGWRASVAVTLEGGVWPPRPPPTMWRSKGRWPPAIMLWAIHRRLRPPPPRLAGFSVAWAT